MGRDKQEHQQTAINKNPLQGGPGTLRGDDLIRTDSGVEDICDNAYCTGNPQLSPSDKRPTQGTKRFIFIFLDGVGIGEPLDKNPFYLSQTEFLPFYKGNSGLPDKTPIKPIDVILGVEGIPQSGSGQTSLYTGENIPRLLGQHRYSYPNRFMRKIIMEKNILSNLKKNGHKAVFINAYPGHSHLFRAPHLKISPSGEFYFSDEFPSLFRRRISVTTCMMVAAGQIPFDEKDILAERSIFQEYTNRWLNSKGLHLPEFAPEKAAEVLYQSALNYNFLLYEYFQTDLYAHRRSFDEQVQLIMDLNRLIGKLISLLNPDEDTLLITSDHGNLEDSSQRNHTCNPVPLLVWGFKADELREGIDTIADVTPSILRFLNPVR
jgi:2,3-bisphosphoglycerate-independent phosphoglycerate mutase